GGRTAALAGPAAGPVALIPRILRSPKGVEHCGSSAQTISSTEISSARAAVALARSDKPQTIRFRYFIGNLTCARDGEESVSAWLRGTSFLPAARFGPSQAHRARARPSLNPTIGSGPGACGSTPFAAATGYTPLGFSHNCGWSADDGGSAIF